MNRSAGHRPGAFTDNVHPPTFLVFFALRAAIYRNVEKENDHTKLISVHTCSFERGGKQW
jgi:hypothetical protein